MARVYDGRIVTLDVDEVKLPNGNVVTLEIIRHRGAAAVVPVDEEGRAVLIRQYRHATSGYLLEVPAGTLDPGEAPETCALREVEEETGLRAARLDPLGWIWTTPGFTDERIWLYLATGLTPTRSAHQSDEVITVERLPFAEAVQKAASGEITDGKSVCALLRASTRRG
jgi:ADP-ribose diphosphatase